MPIIQSAPSAGDFFEYVGSVGGPDEGLWFQIVLVDVFSDGRGQFIGIFHDTDELTAAIGEYIHKHNLKPKPFVWTANASDILEKVTRARRALDNRHSA